MSRQDSTTASSSAGTEPLRLHRLTAIVMLAALLALPAQILRDHFSRDYGFVSLIDFGQRFRERALPEVREFTPPSRSGWGYDGQFYAQLALRPSLDDPALERALDNATYRARLARYRAVIASRSERLLAFLAEPRTIEELVAHRFVYRPQDDVPGIDRTERVTALRHLERLERQGRVAQAGPGRWVAS